MGWEINWGVFKDPLVSFETGIILFGLGVFLSTGLVVRSWITNLISALLIIVGIIMIVFGVIPLYIRKGLFRKK